MSAQVLPSRRTSSIISPPPRNGGASRSNSSRPQRKPTPVGPHILCALAASQSTSRALTSTGMCGTLWHASKSTFAPTACAEATISSTGFAQPRTLETWHTLTKRVRSPTRLLKWSRSSAPFGERRAKRRLQPTSPASICHGTRFEWCSITVSTISSPARMFALAHVLATKFIASLAFRVKMISDGSAAPTNLATFARAPSKASVARMDNVCMPRWTLLLSHL
mmetsp:Transcript_43754/g.126399  ORF Transcript_43754/g.126399 Transcript_43754/m.126399 type:complete len:223 (-) Transcript_43754:409-1077(-)